ncbi:iron responsive element binding protein 2 [Homo sapiens]|uniref:Iron responsive element binding protein 2 n=1 Tax=Homo sapiens TaxID=9606 RepID=H0YL48_HUMAN|nr:iron responsive element binding protein 2 [Homo sapiens]KAI4059044.1 iron responsive element binding protein 2 [Homo sapiens]
MDAPKAGYAFEYLIETLNDSSHKKFFDVSKLGTKCSALLNTGLVGSCCTKL